MRESLIQKLYIAIFRSMNVRMGAEIVRLSGNLARDLCGWVVEWIVLRGLLSANML